MTMARVNLMATARPQTSEGEAGAPLQLARIGRAGGNAERCQSDVGAYANAVHEVRDVERFEEQFDAALSAESQRLRRPKVDRLVRIERQYVGREGSEAPRRAEVVDDLQVGLRIAATDRDGQTRRTIIRCAVSIEIESRIRGNGRTADQLGNGTELCLPRQFGRERRRQVVAV